MASFNERKDNGNGTYSTLTHTTGSDIIAPIEIQSRIASTIQTHNAVSIPLSGNSITASFIDMDGFDKVAFTILCDNGTSTYSMNIMWSNDGTSQHGYESVLSVAAGVNRQAITDIKSRYMKVQVANADASAAHTFSAWAYLKA